MDLNSIDILLEKYWEGKTSVEEESALKAYYASGKIESRHQPYKELFQYFIQERQIHTDDELSYLIDNKNTSKAREWFQNILKVAAVVVIVVVAGYFIREEIKEQKTPYLADTFEDPEAAYAETKKALMLISQNFNKGRQQAKKIGVLNDAQQKAKKIDSDL